MPDGVKCFAKVQGNDDDKLFGGEKTGDGVQGSNTNSCSRSRMAKGELIRE